jgi:C_GCAxxG_C_C family probable redox protein
MISRRDDLLLKAVTGLEGGIVARGSTCGVVTGGSLGLALLHEEELQERGVSAEAGLLSLVGEYVRWFKESYGTSICKERTGVDFYSAKGQIRYFLPGDRLSRCFAHIRGAVRHLHDYGRELPPFDVGRGSSKPIHCARDVLRGIREQTGVEHPLLERISVVFDGGLGLQGEACGALAGAVMGINLVLGMDIRRMSFIQAVRAFLIGHRNLLRDEPIEKPEPFNVGKGIVRRFREEAGAMECRDITGKVFSGWNDFQNYISSSERCSALIKLAVEEASKAIIRWR